jgi:Tol biopolymer transport system component
MIRFGLILFCCLLIFGGCQEKSKIIIKKFTGIIFLSDRDAKDNHFDIFIMKPDGSNQTNLTSHLESVNTMSNPVLSPDGKQVLFLAFESKTSLQLLNITTHEVTIVAEMVKYPGDIQAAFSPRGDLIVFVAKVGNIKQIHTIKPDGGEKRNISNLEFNEYDPCFSADGERIIFVSIHKGKYVIASMDTDGSDKEFLYESKEKIFFPTYSPDDERIAFLASSKNNTSLYIMNESGDNLVKLFDKRAVTEKLYFTPDGSKIVFVNTQRGLKYRDIGYIDTAGRRHINLTSTLNSINQLPLVTPDSKTVIFQSFKYQNSDIYSVDIKSRKLKNLTNHPAWDQIPSL